MRSLFSLLITIHMGSLTAFSAADALPSLYDVPSFELTDQNQKKLTRDQLLGSTWIADFIFTSCGHECPLMTSKMQKIQSQLKSLKQVKFVSITTDPKTDTPKVLKAYAKRHKVDETNWSFLTGSKDAIVALASNGFKLPTDAKSFNHSQKFVLIDTKGKVRGYYDSMSNEEMSKLALDARTIATGP